MGKITFSKINLDPLSLINLNQTWVINIIFSMDDSGKVSAVFKISNIHKMRFDFTQCYLAIYVTI